MLEGKKRLFIFSFFLGFSRLRRWFPFFSSPIFPNVITALERDVFNVTGEKFPVESAQKGNPNRLPDKDAPA